MVWQTGCRYIICRRFRGHFKCSVDTLFCVIYVFQNLLIPRCGDPMQMCTSLQGMISCHGHQMGLDKLYVGYKCYGVSICDFKHISRVCCKTAVTALFYITSFAPNHWFRQVILSTWSCRCKYRKVVSDMERSCQDTRRNISLDVIDCITSMNSTSNEQLPLLTKNHPHPKHWPWKIAEEQHLSRATKA